MAKGSLFFIINLSIVLQKKIKTDGYRFSFQSVDIIGIRTRKPDYGALALLNAEPDHKDIEKARNLSKGQQYSYAIDSVHIFFEVSN